MVLHCPQAIKVLLFGQGVSMDNRTAPLVSPMHPLYSPSRPPSSSGPD